MDISIRRLLGLETLNQIFPYPNQASKQLFRNLEPKRKVLIYGMNYAPEKTGAGRVTGEIGSHLAQNGFDVGVITAPPHYPSWRVAAPYRPWRYAKEFYQGVKIWRCPLMLGGKKMHGLWRLIAPLSFALTSAPVALWNIVKERPKVVLCIEPTLFVAPVALLARFAGAHVLLHVQDLEADAAFAVGHLKGMLLKKMVLRAESWLLRRFSGVITISNRMRELLIAKGVRAERIRRYDRLVAGGVARLHDMQINEGCAKSAYPQAQGDGPSWSLTPISGSMSIKKPLPSPLPKRGDREKSDFTARSPTRRRRPPPS